jgi:conjugative relaxase-like TrwC/TraI family protein
MITNKVLKFNQKSAELINKSDISFPSSWGRLPSAAKIIVALLIYLSFFGVNHCPVAVGEQRYDMGYIAKVTVGKAVSYYYEKDSIFAPEGRGENSEWSGKLAEQFGYEGQVKAEQFEQSIKREALTTKRDDSRAAFDFTLSSPKSVSLAAFCLDDERIVTAHDETVEYVVKYVESNFIEYRLTENDITVPMKSDNICVSKFKHSTSREDDPQLHTHCVLPNMTNTPKGLRSIRNDLLYKHQAFVNDLYQNQLALKIQELGYQIKNYDNKFEIAGISEKAIEVFSKRKKNILEEVPKLREDYPDAPLWKLREIANLHTRKGKVFSSEAELKNKWQKEFPKEELYIPPQAQTTPRSRDYQEYFDRAVQFITKKELAFQKDNILAAMVSQNLGHIDVEVAKEAIEESIKAGVIIETAAKGYYTSPESIAMEQRIIDTVKAGIGSVKPLMQAERVDKAIEGKSLTDEQGTCLKGILTTENRYFFVQGSAGTGKTYLMNELREILEAAGNNIPILGLATQGKAAQGLETKAGIKSRTIASYLNNPVKEGHIIILEECSMLSSRDLDELLKVSKDSRIIFSGDEKQLAAVGGGRIFKDLNHLGIVKTATILTQSNFINKFWV